MFDSNLINSYQSRLFPNTNIITELSQATSIRFMQFCVNSSHYAKQDSKLQKVRPCLYSTPSEGKLSCQRFQIVLSK